MPRKALTLVEVLLTLAIIGVLVALLVPAIQSARESSRRLQCTSNLRQVALALHQYADVNGVLPRSGGNNYSFHVRLLPFLEQSQLYAQFDFRVNGHDYEGPLKSLRLPVLECPSDGSSFFDGPEYMAATNYFGNIGCGSQRYGYNGVFARSSFVPGTVNYLPLSAITDGLSQTAMLAEAASGNGTADRRRCMWIVRNSGTPEALDQFIADCQAAVAHPPRSAELEWNVRGRPWIISGRHWQLYNHVMGPNGPSCWSGQSPEHSISSATSFHAAVVNVALADGSVQTIDENIDLSAWRALGSRDGVP